MTAVEVLDELRQLGVVLEPKGDALRYRAPKGVLTAELRAELTANKQELLAILSTPESPVTSPTELIDLPWPIGYGGLPADEVAKAEFSNDRLDVTDPVERRLNVLMWMRQHFLSKGDLKMGAEMKVAYSELRNADPSIEKLMPLGGQSLEGLLKRLRAGHKWLSKEHTLWLEGSPKAKTGSIYARALAAWSELEEDTRQKYNYTDCIFGADQRCPQNAPVTCDGCRSTGGAG